MRWTTGSPKTRRARRLDASLLDAVERTVERAVRKIVLELRAAALAQEEHGFVRLGSCGGEQASYPVLGVHNAVQERLVHSE